MVGGVRSGLYRSIAAAGGDTWWTHATERAIDTNPNPRSAHV
jgi:hypothetical protein